MPAAVGPGPQPGAEVGQFTPDPGPVCPGAPPAVVDCPFGHTDTEFDMGTVLEKHASSTSLPARNGWVDCTPVSVITTVHPVPSKPAAHAAATLMTALLPL